MYNYLMREKLTDSPLFNVLAFSIFWAIQIFVSKLAFIAGAVVIPFTIQSALFAIIALVVLVLPKVYGEIRTLAPKILLGLLLANAIHYALGGFFSNAGTALTSTVNAGFLVQFSTVTTTILAAVVLKEKLKKSKIVTVVMIIIGSFLLITKGSLIVPRLGDILILLACLSWSTGNVLVRKTLRSTTVSGDVVSFLRPLAGLPVLLFFVLLAPMYPSPMKEVFAQNIFVTEYLGYAALNGLFAALLWIYLNRTLKVASASYMTMMSSLTPVLVTIMAIVFLHERLLPIQILGILMIISSGTITQLLKIDKD